MDENEVIENESTQVEVSDEEQTSTLSVIDQALGEALRAADATESSQNDDIDDEPGEEHEVDEADDEQDDAAEDEEEADALSEDDQKLVTGLSERAQSRFRELTHSVKELNQEKSALEEKVNAVTPLAESMMSAGITPQEIVEFIQMRTAARTGNHQVALQMLERQREQMARYAGVEVPGVDLLSDYPDLAQKVSEFDLSREAALEIAQARRMSQAQQARQQSAQQYNAQQQRYMAGVDMARQQIAQLEQSWKSSNPDYRSIEKDMASFAEYVATNLPPEQWAPAMQRQHDLLATATRRIAKQYKPKTPAPMEPSGRGGGGTKAGPKTTMDVINEAING